jgi:hypothetical protein
MSSIVITYDPPCSASSDVHIYIADNIETFVDEAIKIRND